MIFVPWCTCSAVNDRSGREGFAKVKIGQFIRKSQEKEEEGNDGYAQLLIIWPTKACETILAVLQRVLGGGWWEERPEGPTLTPR